MEMETIKKGNRNRLKREAVPLFPFTSLHNLSRCTNTEELRVKTQSDQIESLSEGNCPSNTHRKAHVP